MSEVSKFNVLGKEINVKDLFARNELNALHIDSKLTEMVVLGDSWSRGELLNGALAYKSPSVLLSEALKLNLHFYGVGGAGYTTGYTFIQQAGDAIGDNSFNHNKVKYIFIIGGVNDSGVPNNTSNIDNNCEAVVNLLLNNFKNAAVVLCPNFPFCTIDMLLEYNLSMIGRYKASYAGRKVITLNQLVHLFTGKDWLFNSDWLHPNQQGYDEYATAIINLMNGGYIADGYKPSFRTGVDWDTSLFEIHKNNKGVRIYGAAVFRGESLGLNNNRIVTFTDNQFAWKYNHTYIAVVETGDIQQNINCIIYGSNVDFATKTTTPGYIDVFLNDIPSQLHNGDKVWFDTFISFENY